MALGYQRTVLVIWPQEFELGTTFADDIGNAMVDLADAQSSKPNKRERKLVEFLLNVAQTRPDDRASIAETLADVACLWNDIGLLGRAVAVCSTSAGAKVLENEMVVRCIETFGFSVFSPL